MKAKIYHLQAGWTPKRVFNRKSLNTPLILFFILSSLKLSAQTAYYVNTITGDDANSGTAVSPFATFHKAYTAASPGDSIDLTGIVDWSSPFETGDATMSGYTIDKSIVIRGQGAGETIIQAEPASGMADRRIFTIDNAAINVRIQDLTLKNGRTEYAGAIYAGNNGSSSATIVIESCDIEENEVQNSTGDAYGGAMVLGPGSLGSVTINKCNIRNNDVLPSLGSKLGGALYICSDSLSTGIVNLANSTLNNNSASNGGGIYARYSNCHIITSTFAYNSAGVAGSAIYLAYAAAGSNYITNVSFAYNSSGGGVSGSAIAIYASAKLSIMNTLLAENTYNAGSNGGDFYFSSGILSNNGYNLVENSSGFTFSATGDITGNQTNLNLSTTLGINGTLNNSLTLAITPGSVAIDAGGNGTNGIIMVPTEDQRGGTQSGSGIDIGAFEYSAGGPVPVSWLNFAAIALPESYSAILTWSTAQEVNNSHFNVQRSQDGIHWETIGRMEGNGNTSSISEYMYEDINPYSVAYYRIQQVDFDGTTDYSTVERVVLKPVGSIQITGANPVSNKLDVVVFDAGNASLEIIDAHGATVYRTHLNGSERELTIDVGSLPSGLYIISVNGDAQKNLRFIKS